MRRGYRRHRRGIQILLSAAVGLLLGVLVIHQMNARLRPAVIVAASDFLDNQVSGEIFDVVDRVLAEREITYDSIYTQRWDASGGLRVLEADLTGLNALTSAVTREVATAFDSGLITQRVEVPMSLAFGGLSFSGRGPKIPVLVESVGNISARFENEFYAQGINQTLHRVVLHVDAELNLLLPGGVYTYVSETPIVLAETVLLGEVPGSYTNLGGDSQAYYYAGNGN
ncbi:MAG: sporulation protein YunB [Oscillospiraceae bacterium]|nr:sporulation protein YunB [Oscillospiraceae bacterium]